MRLVGRALSTPVGYRLPIKPRTYLYILPSELPTIHHGGLSCPDRVVSVAVHRLLAVDRCFQNTWCVFDLTFTVVNGYVTFFENLQVTKI